MWQWWAVMAMGCFAAMQLIFAALGRRGVDVTAMLLYVFAIAAVFYLVHVRASRAVLPHAIGDVALLGGAAVLSYVGNWLLLRGVATAPNPGYAVAISGLQAAVVTVVSVGLLDASFSWSKAAGVLLCAIGVMLLVR